MFVLFSSWLLMFRVGVDPGVSVLVIVLVCVGDCVRVAV